MTAPEGQGIAETDRAKWFEENVLKADEPLLYACRGCGWKIRAAHPETWAGCRFCGCNAWERVIVLGPDGAPGPSGEAPGPSTHPEAQS